MRPGANLAGAQGVLVGDACTAAGADGNVSYPIEKGKFQRYYYAILVLSRTPLFLSRGRTARGRATRRASSGMQCQVSAYVVK